MSSRLFTEIREKLGLTYDIHSYAEHFRETGIFIAQAGLDPQQTASAICAIIEQLARMRMGRPRRSCTRPLKWPGAGCC